MFWRHLDAKCYDEKDLYGNRDFLPAQKACQAVEKAIKHLMEIPDDEARDFYIRTLMIKLRKSIRPKRNCNDSEL